MLNRRKPNSTMNMPDYRPAKPPDEENPGASTEKEDGSTACNIVGWERDDARNPRNWSLRYKIWITFQMGMLALCGSLGSSIISPAEEVIAKYAGVSSEVMVLMISLYM
jgi:hypothetical protein